MKGLVGSDLFLIGVGLMIPGHITVQATRAMLRCDELYSIVQEPARLWLPQERLAEIKVTNVLELYVEGRLRVENYDHVAQTIMKGLSVGRSIGYVTYGNPMAYDRVAQNLVMAAKRLGLSPKIVPGISTVDTILCDLGLDMAPAIQVFDASWLLVSMIKPLVHVPVLLMQVGTFGSLRTHYEMRQDGSSLRELVEYLSKFYSRSHTVLLVRSTAEEEQPVKILRINLGNLCEATAEDLSGASLYIPASEKGPFQEDFVSKMERN
jgi:precorrin-3B methylase